MIPVSKSVIAPHRDLCLDFANTLAYRGSAREESLHRFDDLVGWCKGAGLLGGEIDDLARWSERNPNRAAEVFRKAIADRETIFRIFFSIAELRAPDAHDIAALNLALSRAPARRVLERHGKQFGWRIDRGNISAPNLLAPVLWSAGDLMVSADAARVRHCSNDQCLWLFLDDSKNGTRRWCSMQACGNRAKAHRHYLRAKSLPSAKSA